MTRGLDDGGVRCGNGGECVDGLGDSFSCICTEGWTGATCEVNIDECEEDPCLNDGHCMDLVGDFLCVCPLTWSGRVCEDRVEQCEDNPCLNDALCLVEEDTERGFRCYCVPDCHGPRCQHKYDECRLPPGPKVCHYHGGDKFLVTQYLRSSVSMEASVWMMLTGSSVSVRRDTLVTTVSVQWPRIMRRCVWM